MLRYDFQFKAVDRKNGLYVATVMDGRKPDWKTLLMDKGGESFHVYRTPDGRWTYTLASENYKTKALAAEAFIADKWGREHDDWHKGDWDRRYRLPDLPGPITEELATKVKEIVQEECCWSGGGFFDGFVSALVRGEITEWRFQGWLGFGGKFWVNGKGWYVNTYSEAMDAGTKHMMTRCNQRLHALWLETVGKEVV